MPSVKLLDQVRNIAQVKHMSRRTAQAYVYWIKRFILFHKDIDFGYGQIIVRDGKGEEDRATVLPQSLHEPLKLQIEKARLIHQEDLAAGFGKVARPYALQRKYPNAAKECCWQYVLPASRRFVDRSTGKQRRHHLHESVLQQTVKRAVRKAGISKPASCHTLRHSFATHALESGYDIRRKNLNCLSPVADLFCCLVGIYQTASTVLEGRKIALCLQGRALAGRAAVLRRVCSFKGQIVGLCNPRNVRKNPSRDR